MYGNEWALDSSSFYSFGGFTYGTVLHVLYRIRSCNVFGLDSMLDLFLGIRAKYGYSICTQRELNKMPSFIPFFGGLLALSVILPPLPLLALMGCIVFAVRLQAKSVSDYGKHKIPWNRRKCGKVR